MARARGYMPAAPFGVAMKLLTPTVEVVRGARVKSYPNPSDVDSVFFGSFRTFGGTERMANEIYTVEDTATVDTWFNPSITAECRVYVCATGKTYEVIGTPENIDMRNQYCSFKLRAIGARPNG